MVKNFARAVEQEPQYANACSYLCVAHSNQYWAFDSLPRIAQAAKQALEQAQRLQPDAGETYFAEGMYDYKVRADYGAALVAFGKAREHSSYRVDAIEFSAYVKRRQGKWDDALALHTQSLELDPRNPIVLSEAALTYRALRRLDEAEALVDRARLIDPGNTQLLAQKAEIRLARGDLAEAERLLAGIQIDGADPQVTMACVQLRLFKRQFAEAAQILRHVLSAPEKLPPAFTALPANYRAELAVTKALAGRPEAKADLERARDEMAEIHAKGGETTWSTILLLITSGLLNDKPAVDRVALQLQNRVAGDAFDAPPARASIAAAHALLGEVKTALGSVKELLQTPGDNCLTPPLLRMNPLFDPLRKDPGFAEVAGDPRPQVNQPPN
jgi:serine/threonine-protein kinase